MVRDDDRLAVVRDVGAPGDARAHHAGVEEVLHLADEGAPHVLNRLRQDDRRLRCCGGWPQGHTRVLRPGAPEPRTTSSTSATVTQPCRRSGSIAPYRPSSTSSSSVSNNESKPRSPSRVDDRRDLVGIHLRRPRTAAIMRRAWDSPRRCRSRYGRWPRRCAEGSRGPRRVGSCASPCGAGSHRRGERSPGAARTGGPRTPRGGLRALARCGPHGCGRRLHRGAPGRQGRPDVLRRARRRPRSRAPVSCGTVPSRPSTSSG